MHEKTAKLLLFFFSKFKKYIITLEKSNLKHQRQRNYNKNNAANIFYYFDLVLSSCFKYGCFRCTVYVCFYKLPIFFKLKQIKLAKLNCNIEKDNLSVISDLMEPDLTLSLRFVHFNHPLTHGCSASQWMIHVVALTRRCHKTESATFHNTSQLFLTFFFLSCLIDEQTDEQLFMVTA